MRASKIAVRAALVCSAAGIACAIWSALDEAPAHATDGTAGPLPAVVDLTGGLGDTAESTVEPLPRLATKATERATAAPKLVNHHPDPVKQIRTIVADAVQPITRTAAPAITPPELPLPEAAPARADNPATGAVPAVVLLTGAAPSTVTLDPTRADTTAPAAAAALLCGDDTMEPPRPLRPGDHAAPIGPCIPDDRDAGGLTAVKPPPKTGADQLAATFPSGPATPALRLLGELLPRSDLPTGRTEHPEPGPA